MVSGDPEPVTEWVKDGEQIVLGKDEIIELIDTVQLECVVSGDPEPSLNGL